MKLICLGRLFGRKIKFTEENLYTPEELEIRRRGDPHLKYKRILKHNKGMFRRTVHAFIVIFDIMLNKCISIGVCDFELEDDVFVDRVHNFINFKYEILN